MIFSRLSAARMKLSSWHLLNMDVWLLDAVSKKTTVTSGATLTSSISHMRTAREDGCARFKFLMPSWIPWNNRVRRISRVTSGLHIDVKEVNLKFCVTVLWIEQNDHILQTTLAKAISWMKVLSFVWNFIERYLQMRDSRQFIIVSEKGVMPSANSPLF